MDRDNTVIIFKNSKKKQENSPDFKGFIKINGIEYEASLWTKEGKNGRYIAGSLRLRTNQSEYSNGQQQSEAPKMESNFEL
jgi:hypothetical protein